MIPAMSRKAMLPSPVYRPTDEELITLLMAKASGSTVNPKFYIEDTEHTQMFHPWAVSETDWHDIGGDHDEYHLFTKRKPYRSQMPNGVYPESHWKKKDTQPLRQVLHGDRVVGIVVALSYYCDHTKPTNWVMHEYNLVDEDQDCHVLCKIFRDGHSDFTDGTNFPSNPYSLIERDSCSTDYSPTSPTLSPPMMPQCDLSDLHINEMKEVYHIYLCSSDPLTAEEVLEKYLYSADELRIVPSLGQWTFYAKISYNLALKVAQEYNAFILSERGRAVMSGRSGGYILC